jgi:hypothetical protein
VRPVGRRVAVLVDRSAPAWRSPTQRGGRGRPHHPPGASIACEAWSERPCAHRLARAGPRRQVRSFADRRPARSPRPTADTLALEHRRRASDLAAPSPSFARAPDGAAEPTTRAPLAAVVVISDGLSRGQVPKDEPTQDPTDPGRARPRRARSPPSASAPPFMRDVDRRRAARRRVRVRRERRRVQRRRSSPTASPAPPPR